MPTGRQGRRRPRAVNSVVKVNLQETCGAALKRQQIMTAARACFGAYGFHAASMAQIAAEAHLSVGQIYRYFDNKEAIVSAIVEADLESFGDKITTMIAENNGELPKLVGQLRQIVRDCVAQDRKRIMLEVRAEAARNPKIAEVFRASDTAFRGHLRTLLSATPLGRLPPDELERRIETVWLVLDGAVMRASCRPCSAMGELEPIVDHALQFALTPVGA
jgi:AcrR family transcriptional regulator